MNLMNVVIMIGLTSVPPGAASGDLLKARALKAYRSGKFEVACPLFEKITGRDKDDADTWADLGLCLLKPIATRVGSRS